MTIVVLKVRKQIGELIMQWVPKAMGWCNSSTCDGVRVYEDGYGGT
jgi:hypothetical protein